MTEYEAYQIGLPVIIIGKVKGVKTGTVGIISGRSQFREVLMVVVDGKNLAFLPSELKLVIKTREG